MTERDLSMRCQRCADLEQQLLEIQRRELSLATFLGTVVDILNRYIALGRQLPRVEPPPSD